MAGGSQVWERALHKANTWLRELDDALGWGDLDATLLAMRSVLHALRDRLTPNEAVQLAAQLPLLLKGVYFDGWRPSATPRRLRTRQEFLDSVRGPLIRGVPEADAERVTRAVFRLLEGHVSGGELSDVRGVLPAEWFDLWPATAAR
ncbi:MAG: DUF2267 domain-containing protein [Gemmatimonadota bacterium]